jgi:hypothetical protein
MNIPTGKTFKTYKSRCKTVSDHQYHWHSGSPELPAGSAKKNSNRSGGAHKSRKSKFLNKIKNVGIDLVIC